MKEVNRKPIINRLDLDKAGYHTEIKELFHDLHCDDKIEIYTEDYLYTIVHSSAFYLPCWGCAAKHGLEEHYKKTADDYEKYLRGD